MSQSKDYPFVYIAALQRTGSTLLAETLTQLPYSFIFVEPSFGKNTFSPYQSQVDLLANEMPIDMKQFARFHTIAALFLRKTGFMPDYMIRVVKRFYLPALQKISMQIGVKEINNFSWQHYRKHFPNMRVIITGRDPRDIFISNRRKYERYSNPNPPTPQQLANTLRERFQHQVDIMNQTDHLRLRYEDLCSDTSTFDSIKQYINSPIPDIGKVGQFLSVERTRKEEYRLHGNQITNKHVQHWKSISEPELQANALQMYDLMRDYCQFWGYTEDGL